MRLELIESRNIPCGKHLKQRSGSSDDGFARQYLDEELEVDIVGLGRDALGPLVPPAGNEVDTLSSRVALAHAG